MLSTIRQHVAALSSNNKEIKLEGISALWGLAVAKDKSNISLIGQAGAIPPLVRLISDSDMYLRQLAIGCLVNLAPHAETKALIAQAGAIPLLAHCLSDSDMTLRQYAALCLANLAEGPHNKTLIVQAGAIPFMVRFLSDSTLELRHYATLCLGNLAEGHHNKTLIVQAGAIPFMVRFLSDSYMPLRQGAIGCLYNLAREEPHNKTLIVQAGAISPLVHLLSDSTAEVRNRAVSALVNLAENNINIEIIKQSESYQQVVKRSDAIITHLILKIEGYNESVQRNIAELISVLNKSDAEMKNAKQTLDILTNLAWDKDSNTILVKKEIIRLGGVNKFSALMFNNDPQLCLQGIRGLSGIAFCDHTSQNDILAAPEILPQLVTLLRSSNNELIAAAAGAISNIAGWGTEGVNEGKNILRKCGAIPIFAQLLESDDNWIQVNVSEALMTITTDNIENQKIIVNTGILTKLEKLATKLSQEEFQENSQKIITTCQFLLEQGFLNSVVNKVMEGNLRNLKPLFLKLKYPNAIILDNLYQDTILHCAIREKKIEIVWWLLEQEEINPNLANGKGETPINLARLIQQPLLLFMLGDTSVAEAALKAMQHLIEASEGALVPFYCYLIRGKIYQQLGIQSESLAQREIYFNNALRDIERSCRSEATPKNLNLRETINKQLMETREALTQQRETNEKQKKDILEIVMMDLHNEWETGNPRSLVERYQELLKEHTKSGALYREAGEFYAFQANRAGAMIQKQKLYEKALNYFKRAIELDEFDDNAAALYEGTMASLQTLSIAEKKSETVSLPKIVEKKTDHLTEEEKRRFEEIKERKKAELVAQRNAASGVSQAGMFSASRPESANKSLHDNSKFLKK